MTLNKWHSGGALQYKEDIIMKLWSDQEHNRTDIYYRMCRIRLISYKSTIKINSLVTNLDFL